MRRSPLLLWPVVLIGAALGTYFVWILFANAYDIVCGPRHSVVTARMPKADYHPERADIEPNAIVIDHDNRAFLGSQVVLTTSEGKRSATFFWHPVVCGQSVRLENPGRMRDGWTLSIRPWYRKAFVFRSKRTGPDSIVSAELFVRSETHTAALYLANSHAPDSTELILHPTGE